MRLNSNPSIGIVTSAQLDASKPPVLNLINILYPLSNNICLIILGHDLFKENKKIHSYEIQYKMGSNAFTKVVKYIYLQIRISYKLAKITKNVDFWIFFIGGNSLVLPVITAKLLRKKVVLALPGSITLVAKFSNDILSKQIEILEKFNLILSNKIILYSPNLIKEYGLEKYKNKVSIAHEHFLDFDKFKIKKQLDERENLIGYIGRLSGEKGVINFVKAIPEIIRKRGKVKFMVGGDGPLRNKIEEYLDEYNLNNEVKLLGWIPHDELPDYLNELKFVVLPSYTEGLPNVMLEAMACGTPVLATPVGAIPDIIKDGETGFVMANNSPECIAENVVRALEHSNSEEIVKDARELVEREFTYKDAVERYRTIMEEL